MDSGAAERYQKRVCHSLRRSGALGHGSERRGERRTLRLASLLDHRRLVKVGRDSERASCSWLAVGAVANAVHRGQRVERDRGLPAGACCCHWIVLQSEGLSFEA